ncbi:Transcription initiation factor TFIID subunit 9 [Myotisia sp. PD_48]|nr:Transcription initiation factor TFIID subunit 9 [Myotisia sp. PD_48]
MASPKPGVQPPTQSIPSPVPEVPATSNAPAAETVAPAQIPSTSLQDSGKSRRPRDARLIHMLLASLGVTAYQERVPLQLLDFAYRYTSSTLQDAVYLATEGYPGDQKESGKAPANAQDGATISLGALRMSIASRLHYQFQPGLPKEFLLDIANERNRVLLPGVSRGQDTGSAGGGVGTGPNAAQESIMGGIRLPAERFCLTGVGWDLKGEWESEGEEDMDIDQQVPTLSVQAAAEEGDDEDDNDGRMEDVFGLSGMEGGDQDEDKDMIDV